MNKISSKDATSLLKQAGVALVKVAKERDTLREKVAAFERDQRVVKIARDMEEKGLSSDLTFEEKVAAMKSAKNLDITEEAIKLAAPQGRVLGGLGDVPGGGDSKPGEDR